MGTSKNPSAGLFRDSDLLGIAPKPRFFGNIEKLLKTLYILKSKNRVTRHSLIQNLNLKKARFFLRN